MTPLPDDLPATTQRGRSGISHKLTSVESRVSQDPIVVKAGVGLKRLFGLIFHGRHQSFGFVLGTKRKSAGKKDKKDFFFGVMNL